MSESTSLFIGLFVHFVSLLLPLALCSLFYRDRLFSMRIFAPAQRGVSLIAIPITLAFGLLGEMIGAMIGDLSEIFGFLLRSQQNYHTMSDAAIWYTLFGTLLVAVLSEILIHGMALTALRRYGDGFAVVCCAILSALMTSSAISAVSMFVFSLCAGYFAIRGGSLRPILIARILRELISFGFPSRQSGSRFFDKSDPDRGLSFDCCGGFPRLRSLYPSGCKCFPAGASRTIVSPIS